MVLLIVLGAFIVVPIILEAFVGGEVQHVPFVPKQTRVDVVYTNPSGVTLRHSEMFTDKLLHNEYVMRSINVARAWCKEIHKDGMIIDGWYIASTSIVSCQIIEDKVEGN